MIGRNNSQASNMKSSKNNKGPSERSQYTKKTENKSKGGKYSKKASKNMTDKKTLSNEISRDSGSCGSECEVFDQDCQFQKEVQEQRRPVMINKSVQTMSPARVQLDEIFAIARVRQGDPASVMLCNKDEGDHSPVTDNSSLTTTEVVSETTENSSTFEQGTVLALRSLTIEELERTYDSSLKRLTIQLCNL